MKRCSDRRNILSLPAVRPCSGATPAALLSSLIVLTRDIIVSATASRRRSTTHRRALLEVLREATVLLSFFEDVHVDNSLSPHLRLPLAEIHVALQRLKLLLADVSRPGASLWILMNADRVACELRILVRTIATCLDVLPLDEIDADEDSKQLIRMLAQQAWRVDLSTDFEDSTAADEVQSILRQLENNISPSTASIKRVLKQLKLNSWFDCSSQVSFLEEELFWRTEDENGGGTAFLSSLIGFMTYCRSTILFKDSLSETNQYNRIAVDDDKAIINGINPEELRCPITLDLMIDPVTVSTGQTYNRSSIRRWLNQNSSCPVSGKKLTNCDLVPNLAIRNIVHRFCRANNTSVTEPGSQQKRDLSKTASGGSRAAEGALRLTIEFLVSKISNGNTTEKKSAAYEIRLLSKSSLFNRACLVESGAVPQLLRLLSSSDSSAQENSAAALLNISKHPSGRRAIIEADGLKSILGALTEGLKLDIRQNAAAILFYLSSSNECRKTIGEMPAAIPALAELLKKGTYRGQKNAVVALFGLLLHHENLQKVLDAGAVQALTELISSDKDDLVSDAVAVLAKISDKPEGAKSILRSPAIPLIVKVLKSTSSGSCKEYCLSILLSLCNNGEENTVKLLEEMHSVIPSLYTLITEGSPQAGKKARLLLDHIHRLYDLNDPVLYRIPPRDRVIHAQ